MYKGSIDLGRINQSVKLSLNVIIKGDDYNMRPGAGKVFKHVVDLFDYNGSRYLKVSPRSFITIDISKSFDRGDSWNSNMQVNLTKQYLFEFITKCKLMIENFKIKELFYIKNKKLQINAEIANSLSQVIKTQNKTIKMIHSVVYDTENKEIEYEGIVLMINSIDNYSFITYNELQYMYYIISTTNMDILSMELINTYLILNNNVAKPETRSKIISEKTDTSSVSTLLPKEQKPNTIPNI